MNQGKRAQKYKVRVPLNQIEEFKILMQQCLLVILNQTHKLLRPKKHIIQQQWTSILDLSQESYSQGQQLLEAKMNLSNKFFRAALTSALKSYLCTARTKNLVKQNSINLMEQPKQIQKLVKQAGLNLGRKS